jgi:hypothetical protein
LPLTREKIIAGKKTQMIMRISGWRACGPTHPAGP